jgi:serine/threonine protein kinase
MSNDARMMSGSLPSDINQVCRAFEAAWQTGQRPPIEEYLREIPAAWRAALLRELLRLDVIHRDYRREKPTPQEYLSRFPGDSDLIHSVFGDMPTAAGTQEADSSHGAYSEARQPTGDWIAPGYEILGQLEPGGMGVVYRARQVGLNRTVALKMIRMGVQAGAEERARFRIEAEAVASLSHPNVIQIHDYGEWNGMPYLAMEFAEGGSLRQHLARAQMSPAEAAELIETLARAVHFVHERGVIHRDLKPANVLLTGEGVPKLADFGLAKRLDRDQGLTRSQAVLGTASYMAPEQAAGDKHALGPAADVYALGAILYEMLTGRPPFKAETHELTIHQVLSEEPLPPTRLRPEVAVELEAICLKCLEKEPAHRFASALTLAEDLRRYKNGEPISVQSLGPFEWHRRAARRGGYEILEVLGQSGLGFVYKAQHLRLNRTVALRMFASREAADVDRLGLLRAEVETAARLHHPNIVQVYDFGEYQGQAYIAEEFIEGCSLAEELAGPLKSAEATATLIETLARALHHAHVQQVAHGSMKPSKVRLGIDGATKITLFSFAKLLRIPPPFSPDIPNEEGRGDLLKGGTGVSSYSAPEQGAGLGVAVTPATDVYALGAILYELLAGRPLVTEGVSEMLVRVGNPEPPRHWRPEVSSGLEAICLKCLEREPAERYPSAAALAEDLRRFRSGEVLFIDNLDTPAQQERWARRAGYEILEALGSGPNGFSYKARQVGLNRIVVLNRIAAEYRFVPTAKSRFRREAQFLAGLRHPNFVQLYDQGEQNDLSYFAREFVDGPNLAEKVAEAPFPPQLAAEMVEALAEAVHAAHSLGAVHGGLDPGKVRLTPSGVPKITGFRRAWLPASTSEEGPKESKLRRAAAYLAPEQLERGRRFHPATDIYALGAILYTLLTGHPPFSGHTLAETMEQVRSQAPTRPSQWRPSVPSDLEAICLTCLEKQIAHRPASAEGLAEELRDWLAEWSGAL